MSNFNWLYSQIVKLLKAQSSEEEPLTQNKQATTRRSQFAGPDRTIKSFDDCSDKSFTDANSLPDTKQNTTDDLCSDIQLRIIKNCSQRCC